MADLRPYQLTAVAEVQAHWDAGVKRVVLVLPTGGGKTITATAPVKSTLAQGGRVLWLAHRRELIGQAAKALVSNGIRDVGMISPQHKPNRWAKMQVASSDTLVARGYRPEADLIVADEVHHFRAKTYQALLSAYPEAYVLGLTATPGRSDEQPLGDIFEQLVVGATYSQMLDLNREHPDQGIVPCRVFQSPEYLGSDLAREPLDAWHDLVAKGLDGPCVVFCRSVDDAKERVRQFRMAGVKTAIVTGNCGSADRAKALEDFAAGRVRVLVNVAVLTEGVDIPSIAVCMLASGCSSALSYLQKVGRALRPAPGKEFAVLVDLVGVSLPGVYGSPTADRHYSLDGNPITVEGASLKHCPKCGMSVAMALRICDGFMPKTGEPCKYVFEGKPRRAVKIWNLELQEAANAAGGDVRLVPREAKLREAQTLLLLARTNGYDPVWAVQRWRKTFQEARFPEQLLTPDERRVIYAKFVAQGKAAGWKPIAARMKYKALLGNWPGGEREGVAR